MGWLWVGDGDRAKWTMGKSERAPEPPLAASEPPCPPGTPKLPRHKAPCCQSVAIRSVSIRSVKHFTRCPTRRNLDLAATAGITARPGDLCRHPGRRGIRVHEYVCRQAIPSARSPDPLV